MKFIPDISFADAVRDYVRPAVAVGVLPGTPFGRIDLDTLARAAAAPEVEAAWQRARAVYNAHVGVVYGFMDILMAQYKKEGGNVFWQE